MTIEPLLNLNAERSALAARGKVRMGKFRKQPFNFSTLQLIGKPAARAVRGNVDEGNVDGQVIDKIVGYL